MATSQPSKSAGKPAAAAAVKKQSDAEGSMDKEMEVDGEDKAKGNAEDELEK